MTDLFDKFVAKYGRLPTERDPDYLEMLRMSKYRILPVADVQPGKCANCGASKSDGRSYVDFGLDIPWFGCVFLCSLCLKDIARNVGLFKELEEELATARKMLAEKEALEQSGKELIQVLSDGFEGVKRFLDRDGVRPVGDFDATDRAARVESYQEPDKSAAGEGDRPSNAAKQRAAKPTSVSGPKDLLSLAEQLQA